MTYSNINIQIDKFGLPKPDVYSLTFGLLNWGEIAAPIYVDYLNYEYNIGTKVETNKITYTDILSYMNKSPQTLIAYRISPTYNLATFDALGDISSVIGVSHSHCILRHINSVGWTPNRSEEVEYLSIGGAGTEAIYLKLNDSTEAQDEPVFGAFGVDSRMLAIFAKYAGDYANDIKITLCSFLDDMNIATVFDESLGYSRNYYLNELFETKLKINEYALVVCIGESILEKHVFSLDPSSIAYIDNMQSDFITCLPNTNYDIVYSSDSLSVQLSKTLMFIQSADLLFGSSGHAQITIDDYSSQMEYLKDRYFVDFRLMFTSGDNETVHMYAKNVVDARLDSELLIGCHEKLNVTTAEFGIDSFGLTPTGTVIALPFDLTTYYETIDSKNVAFFYNYKKIDVNGTIEVHSIAGDIAGALMQSMITMRFKELNFFDFNSDLVGINDIAYQTINTLNHSYINILSRKGSTYNMQGNYVMKDSSYGFDYQMIKIYAISVLLLWGDTYLHEVIDNTVYAALSKLIKNLNIMLIGYVSNFKIDAQINEDDFRIGINVGFQINDKYEGMTFLLRDNTSL